MIDRIGLPSRKGERLFHYDRFYMMFSMAVASASCGKNFVEYTHSPFISFIMETIYARTIIEEPSSFISFPNSQQ